MGLITAADVDAAIGPALRIRFRTGDFDPAGRRSPTRQIQSTETPWATDEAKARALRRDPPDDRAAQERERDAAPRSHRDHQLAVIGPRADSVVRDWYGGTPALP